MRELEIIRQISRDFSKNIKSVTDTKPIFNKYLWTFGVLNKTRLMITFEGKLYTDSFRQKRTWYFVNINHELIYDGGENEKLIPICYSQSLAQQNILINP